VQPRVHSPLHRCSFEVASMLVTRSGSGMSGLWKPLSQRPSDLIYEIAVHQSRSRHSSSQKMRTHPKYNSRTTRQSPSRLLAQTTCSSACTAPGPRSTFFSTCVPSSTRVPSPYPDLADSRSGGCHTTVDIAISGKVPDSPRVRSCSAPSLHSDAQRDADAQPPSELGAQKLSESPLSSPSPSPIPNPPSSELSKRRELHRRTRCVRRRVPPAATHNHRRTSEAKPGPVGSARYRSGCQRWSRRAAARGVR
jgi:hypothetical protein